MESSFSTRPFIFDAQPPRARRYALRPGRVLFLIAVMMWSSSVACLWTNESRLVFQARRSRFARPVPAKGLIQLRTTDGIRLDALSLTHEQEPAHWILFCPPSGRTIHGRVRRHLESLHAAGYNVFAFDYRGFGRNAGTPSEAGVYEDALTAYRHLTQELGVAPQRIILAGRSLGSAVAIELATRVPTGGLLLLSAIDSVPATASRFYFWAPVNLIASQRFDSMSKASRVSIPVLQVHAPNDWLVPIDAARALFGRFAGRKVMLELPGGHNEAGFADESLRRALAEFWPRPAQSGLAPTGTLRAVYLTTNPAHAVTEAAGEPRGTVVDMTRELGRRLGVRVALTGVQAPQNVIDTVQRGDADIGFVAYNPERAGPVEFSQPFMLVQQTFIVREDSSIRSVADIDRADQRIGAGKGDSIALYLARTLKLARLVEMPPGDTKVAVQSVLSGSVHAFGANRQRLSDALRVTTGLRLLGDDLYGVEQTIIVPKGRPEALAAVNRFIDDIRASGFLHSAIDRSGIAGISVAPARSK